MVFKTYHLILSVAELCGMRVRLNNELLCYIVADDDFCFYISYSSPDFSDLRKYLTEKYKSFVS